MLGILPLLLSGAAASPAPHLAPRRSPAVNITEIPITFPNKTASVNISVGTPPQTIPVELSLALGGLQVADFKRADSSSFQDNPARDNVVIGDVTLEGWEIGNNTNDAGLGGTLPLGLTPWRDGVATTYVPWALADKIPGNTFSLSIGLDNSTLNFGPESGIPTWWNPSEDAMGAWAFIIDGVAVDGQMAILREESGNAVVTKTHPVDGTNPTVSSVPGSSPPQSPSSSPSPSVNPLPANPSSLTDRPVNRRQEMTVATPATPGTRAPAPATIAAPAPVPSTDANGDSCVVACTLEFKVCMCAEGEMCRRHNAECRQCPYLECVRNNTSTETEGCIACPAIYKACACGPDEDCVRTLATCKSCETVECRKRGSVEPANPQWEEEPVPTVTSPGPTNPTGPFTSGTIPTENKPGNCSNPVMCPAIYQLCSCRADEMCIRRNACDRCEWLECHKVPEKPFSDPDGKCVQCEPDLPECDCPMGTTCVREPRSCGDCGTVTCRNNTDPGLRLSLSLDDEIAISPQVATALQKLVPGMVAIGGGGGERPSVEPRAPTVSTTATAAASDSGDNSASVSITAPPRPEGKTYYSVPCNTTANITLVFPGGHNYTLEAKDWVQPRHDGCQAVLVMQDTLFSDMVLGQPFLRTVRAAFRLNNRNPTVAFTPRNGSTTGANAKAGTSGAGALSASLVTLLGALAAVCVL